MAKQAERHNPDHVAQIAAQLLQGRHDAEPHHVKQAVSTARLIIDAARAEPEEPAAEPEPAPEPKPEPEPQPEPEPKAEAEAEKPKG
jgi:hypothetical protein